MKTKLLEIRDHATCIPALAIEISSADGWLALCAGYNSPCILFGRADAQGPFHYDPFEHTGRTLPAAHAYIIANWDKISHGDLIDVRVVLGEASVPCTSDRYER